MDSNNCELKVANHVIVDNLMRRVFAVEKGAGTFTGESVERGGLLPSPGSGMIGKHLTVREKLARFLTFRYGEAVTNVQNISVFNH